MASSDATFPDDMEALKAPLLAREAALREHEDELRDLRDTVTTRHKTRPGRALEIEHLKQWIVKLQRMQSGRKRRVMNRSLFASVTTFPARKRRNPTMRMVGFLMLLGA